MSEQRFRYRMFVEIDIFETGTSQGERDAKAIAEAKEFEQNLPNCRVDVLKEVPLASCVHRNIKLT